MQTVVNGQLLSYTDEGKGSVILILHGWGSSGQSFEDLASYLSKRHRVIRLDFPGFGGSPQPSTDWGVAEYASCVRDFITKLGVKIDILVGHSFGGRVIIKGIAEGKLSPKKVILIGSAGVKPKPSTKKRLIRAAAKIGKVMNFVPGASKLRDNLRHKLYNIAGSTDYIEAGEMQRIFINTIDEDLLPLVHKIKQPTLMIWGEDDASTPVSDAHSIKAELSDANLVVIPGAAHFVYLDKPDEVREAISKFI